MKLSKPNLNFLSLTVLILITINLLILKINSSALDIGSVETVSAQTTDNPWPMAGANPQRTSWTPEEVKGNLKPVWYRPIDPYISNKVQVIADNNLLYVSTSTGLYTFNPNDGGSAWTYPADMPLGNSPTIEGTVIAGKLGNANGDNNVDGMDYVI